MELIIYRSYIDMRHANLILFICKLGCGSFYIYKNLINFKYLIGCLVTFKFNRFRVLGDSCNMVK